MTNLPTFCPSVPLLHRHSLPSQTRHANRPYLARRSSRAKIAPTSQLAGNIEDMPAEQIPATPSSIPSYWHRPGVYGIYASDGSLQYVSSEGNIAHAIEGHMRHIPDRSLLHSVRMLTVDALSDAPLGDIAESWVLAHTLQGPGAPPGNSDAAPEWREQFSKERDVCIDAATPDTYLHTEIKFLLRKFPVVLFMKGTSKEPRCGYSLAALELLQKYTEEFVCVDCLDEVSNPGLRQGIKTFSEWPTIPQLYVDGEFIGGYDILVDMDTNNQLDTLFGNTSEQLSTTPHHQ